MQQASLKRVSKRKKEEAISYISSYQTLTADKNLFSSHIAQKKSGCRYAAIAVNLLIEQIKSLVLRGNGFEFLRSIGENGKWSRALLTKKSD